jgi:hypothetical protein
MSRRLPTDHQRAILAGLAAGRRLVGPVTVMRPRKTTVPALRRETRKWGWADGAGRTADSVHVHAVEALAAHGRLVIAEHGDRREARLA